MNQSMNYLVVNGCNGSWLQAHGSPALWGGRTPGPGQAPMSLEPLTTTIDSRGIDELF